MKLIRFVCVIAVFVFFTGIVPRTYQTSYPTVYAGACVIVCLFANRFLKALLR